MSCFYGLPTPARTREYARVVCDVLGHGENSVAVDMLIETAAQETHCGRYKDPTPNGAGRGLYQMDEIAFRDVVNRTRIRDVLNVLKNFGVDIRTVKHDALDFSPLLASIFCRLFYKLVPDVFPLTRIQRASYWKRHYNTSAGRGSVSDYLINNELYGV